MAPEGKQKGRYGFKIKLTDLEVGSDRLSGWLAGGKEHIVVMFRCQG